MEGMMVVGAATFALEITDGMTLKDKRAVVRSLLDRVRSRFNVSAAEVGQLDSVRHATLAVVAVANEEARVQRVLQKVADLVEGEPRAVVLEFYTEML
jgi:hypothetical protein